MAFWHGKSAENDRVIGSSGDPVIESLITRLIIETDHAINLASLGGEKLGWSRFAKKMRKPIAL